MLQVIGLSLYVIAVYNATGGSVLMAVVMHWMANLGATMNIHAYDDASNIISAIFYCVAALAVFGGTAPASPVTVVIDGDDEK